MGNDEEEDDRLEDQQLLMSRLACTKVRGTVTVITFVQLQWVLILFELCLGGATTFARVPAAPGTPETGPPAAESTQLP